MSATRRGYALPIQGPPTKITTVRVREDPADFDSYIDNTVTYVDGQLDERWVDCFKLDGDTYDMTALPVEATALRRHMMSMTFSIVMTSHREGRDDHKDA